MRLLMRAFVRRVGKISLSVRARRLVNNMSSGSPLSDTRCSIHVPCRVLRNTWYTEKEGRAVRCGPEVGQIGPKWDKFGNYFEIRFSTFWLTEPKCTESDLKNNSEFVPFGANLTHFGLKSDTHALLADGER